jgi:hypothetical protein
LLLLDQHNKKINNSHCFLLDSFQRFSLFFKIIQASIPILDRTLFLTRVAHHRKFRVRKWGAFIKEEEEGGERLFNEVIIQGMNDKVGRFLNFLLVFFSSFLCEPHFYLIVSGLSSGNPSCLHPPKQCFCCCLRFSCIRGKIRI